MSPRTTKTADDDSQELSSAVQDLASVVERLRDEVETLRQAVDELREELTFELRKLRNALPTPEANPPYRLTSMPNDPCVEDFQERVNAFDGRVFDTPQASDSHDQPRAKTVGELVARLVQEPPAARLAADDWVEDQEFPPGEAVEIESTILDWFAEDPVAVAQSGNWFVVEYGLGSLFLLWTSEAQCFVRRLTDDQQREFCELAEVVLDVEPDECEVVAPSPQVPAESESPANQQTLW